MSLPQASHSVVPAPHAPCGACLTHVRNLGVRLGGHVVLDDLTFDLRCGEITALVGPNGAGKTTLLRALLGEVPYTGSCHFQGGPGHPTRRLVIGYVPQRLAFDRAAPLTVADLFAIGCSHRPAFFGLAPAARTAAIAALEEVDASHLLNRRLGDLSGGEMQRVLLALSLSPEPDLLLLDEPQQGLDAAGLERFHEVVARLRGRFDLAVVLVSHDLAGVARVADRVFVLDRRLLAAGPPAEVLHKMENGKWQSGNN
ncbi:MAG TPA: metal ABC transporter ATP-binding protein [Opitutales bacterium]|jgi:zinc transport system ATP-binding protein|nr:metal ABC transporter ATP-binding protein [Opitutales bacterium]